MVWRIKTIFTAIGYFSLSHKDALDASQTARLGWHGSGIALAWLWHGSGMALAWLWHGSGMPELQQKRTEKRQAPS
jgi:hypothetical protein